MAISISASAFQQNQNKNTINPKAGMIKQSEIQKINEQASNRRQAITQMPEAPMPPGPLSADPTNQTITNPKQPNEPNVSSTGAAAFPQIAPQPQNIQPNTTYVPPNDQEKSFENNHSTTYFHIQNNKKEQFYAQKYAMLNVKNESFKEERKHANAYTQQSSKNKNLTPYIERARRAGITDSKIKLELSRKNEANFIAWVERATNP